MQLQNNKSFVEAVKNILEEINLEVTTCKSICNASYELIDEGRGCGNKRFFRDLDVLKSAEIAAKRANKKIAALFDFLNSSHEQAEPANEIESADSSSIHGACTV